jgi:hypothetical protein
MSESVLPDRPLDRFHLLFDALVAEKRWFDDTWSIRYAASSLLTVPGDPAGIARDLRRLAEELKERAGWFGPLDSPVRFVVAAMLLQADLDTRTFCAEVERIEELFKSNGLKRGSVYTHLAVLLLMVDGRRLGKRVDEAVVRRFRALYDELKSHHRFLTGQDDYAACALLNGLDRPPQEIGARCEVFYEGLRDLGFNRGNALQSVSHALVFAPDDDQVVMRRFRALYDQFDGAGLWMNTGDYDEVAALSFLPQPAERVVSRVLEHRAVLAEKKPKPDRALSFSLACATGFLELVKDEDAHELMRNTQNVIAVQAILQAQQAAMIAAAVSASASASAASH